MSNLPQGFVYLSDIDESIIQEPIYHGENNFVGTRIDGYNKPVIILTKEAAEALKKVQEQLKPMNLGLKVIDGYRPQSACDHFLRWAEDDDDLKMKAEFYPRIDRKVDLFKGYVARKSGHSRGSTADLTIVHLDTGKEMDMGSRIDMLDPVSHVISDEINEQQQENRLFLKKTMEENDFEGYSKEWWHFQLNNEPFPRRPEDHFNFPVE